MGTDGSGIVGKKVFLFAFMAEVPPTEKQKFINIVKKLGGICKPDEDMYVSDCTHIVVPDKIAKMGNKWCPKVFGALASGKHVIMSQFLIQSDTSGRFLKEAEFVPPFVTPIVDHVSRQGKPFVGQTSIVIVDNHRRQAELKVILRDGGAKVPNWSVTDLRHKPLQETRKLDIIYTDTMQEKAMSNFVQRCNAEKEKQGDRPLSVLSYFCIFKVITTPVLDRENRRIMESQFDVNNKDLMFTLHPQTAPQQMRSSRPISNRSIRNNRGVVPIDIKLESSDEDDDIQILSDEDVKVVETKRIPPAKRRKMTKDIVYEIPNKTQKIEVIDLSSSDEEPQSISTVSAKETVPKSNTKCDIIHPSPPLLSQGEMSQKTITHQDNYKTTVSNKAMSEVQRKLVNENCDKKSSIGEVEKPPDQLTEPNVDNPNTYNGKKDPPPKEVEISVKTFVGQNTGWSSSRNDSRSKTIGNSSGLESLPICNENVKVIFLLPNLLSIL